MLAAVALVVAAACGTAVPAVAGGTGPAGHPATAAVAPATAVLSTAAPTAPVDLTPGLRVEGTSTHTVDLAAAVVRVEHAMTLTHQVPDTVTSSYVQQHYFPEYALPVLSGATALAATGADGAALPVRLEDDGSGFPVAVVDLRPDLLFGRSATVRLTYELPTQPPRSDALAQVNRAFATFPVLTTADPGLGTVRVVTSEGVTTEVAGADLDRTDEDGGVVHTAAAVADPAAWWATVIVRDDAELVQRLVFFNDIGIKVQGWPGDEEWLDFTSDLAERGLPELRDMIGLPWSNDGQLTIVETSAPYVYGYGGWYERSRSLIEVGDALDAHVTLHEMAHAWFNEELFEGRWVNEALADELAAVAMERLGMQRPVPDEPVPGAPGEVALAQWLSVDPTVPGLPEREAYGYNAAWWVGHRLVAEIGVEGVADVVAAAAAGRSAYPAGSDGARAGGPVDWRGFLDLLEEVGGSTGAEELFRAVVVGDVGRAELDSRSAAREEYDRLLTAGDGWAPPAAVREAMAAWRFGDARAMLPEVSDLLRRRDELAEDLRGTGVPFPAALQVQFETATDLRDLAGTVDAASEASGAVAEVAAQREDAGVLAEVGLLLGDADRDLADARAALDGGDYAAASTSARAAAADLDGASTAGVLRLLAAALAVALVVLGVAVGRRRARRAGLPPQAAPAPAPDVATGPAPDATDSPEDAPVSHEDAPDGAAPVPSEEEARLTPR